MKTSDVGQKGAVPVRALVYVGVLAGVFLLGFIPMWMQAREAKAETARLERQLRISQLQLSLATAAIDARRGEYEPARQHAAAFYQALTSELNKEFGSAIPPAQQPSMKQLMDQRDMVITLLARSDPASAERLATMYVLFRKSAGP